LFCRAWPSAACLAMSYSCNALYDSPGRVQHCALRCTFTSTHCCCCFTVARCLLCLAGHLFLLSQKKHRQFVWPARPASCSSDLASPDSSRRWTALQHAGGQVTRWVCAWGWLLAAAFKPCACLMPVCLCACTSPAFKGTRAGKQVRRCGCASAHAAPPHATSASHSTTLLGCVV
jgi:hypothetical protein